MEAPSGGKLTWFTHLLLGLGRVYHPATGLALALPLALTQCSPVPVAVTVSVFTLNSVIMS